MVADKRKPRDKWPLAQPHARAKTSQICFLPNGFEDPNSRTPATSSSTHGPRGRGCHIYPTRNRIFGEPPSVDEFLEPAEEQQVGEFFEGGDEAIIAVVRQEMAEKAGQVIGVDSEEEDDPQPEVRLARKCLRCHRVSGSKEAASSSEMLTPQFHWTW
jgi:hypothetical protein